MSERASGRSEGELAAPLVDPRRAVYDTTATAKPFLALRDAVTEFLRSVVGAVGRDPDPVVGPLESNTSWWMRVGTQQYLAAVHVATADDAIVQLDIDYDFHSEETLTVPNPDALPLVDDDGRLTVTLVFDDSRPVTPDVTVPDADSEHVAYESRAVQRVPAERRETATTTPGDQDRPAPAPRDGASGTDDGPAGDDVTVVAVGPEGEEQPITLDSGAKIGAVVATLARQVDGVAAVDLSRDPAGEQRVASDDPAEEFDGHRLYWRPAGRTGGGD